MKEFFERRLRLAATAGGTHHYEGLRGWMAQELVNAGTGVSYLKANELVEEYLMGIILAEAAALRTRSTP
jgi:hypothetical protein